MNSRLAVYFWLLLNILPFFILSKYREVLFDHNPALHIAEPTVLLFLIPFILAAELFSLVLLFRMFPGKYLGTILFFLTSAGFFLVILSWAYFSVTGVFVNWSELGLLGHFKDGKTIVSLMSPREFFSLAIGALGSLLAAWMFRRAAKRAGTKATFQHFLANLFVIIIVFSGLLLIKGPRALSVRQGYISNFLSPRYSLLYSAPLSLFSNLQKTLPGLEELELKEREPLEKAIKHDSQNLLIILVEALRDDAFKEAMPILYKRTKNQGSHLKIYSASTETAYAQTTIVTGQYPLRSNYREMGKQPYYPMETIYQYFQKQNYRTAQFANQWSYIRNFVSNNGLDLSVKGDDYHKPSLKKYLPKEWKEVNPTLPTAITDIAYKNHFLDWVTENDKPFMSMIYLQGTHFPYDYFVEEMGPPLFPHPPLPSDYTFFDYPIEDAPLFRQRYHNMVAFADRLISELLEGLSKRGKLENTVVLITGDHGDAFHDPTGVTHGRQIIPSVVEVPLLMFGGSASLGQDCLGGHVDIFPTALEALNLPKQNLLQGKSLIMTNETCQVQPVFIVAQGLVYETAVAYGKQLLSSNHVSGRYYIQKGQKMERVAAENYQTLSNCLSNFRNKQLGYYGLKKEALKKYAPPYFESCP